MSFHIKNHFHKGWDVKYTSFQTKLLRQEQPYPSNCTRSWKRTNFTELMKDQKEDGDVDDNALRYNMAVRIQQAELYTQN